MGDERSRRFAELLSLQLNMNKQTLAALREHGVDEETPLRLDFSYEAPSQRAGEAGRDSLPGRRRGYSPVSVTTSDLAPPESRCSHR